ncbi:MAG TPA: transposase [Streptosporangiaceae bacterium]|nr:transposase [Streptosporangiaceae bacterium]
MFREQLTARGWQYAVAVTGGTTAHDGDAVPRARPCGGLGQPPRPADPGPPVTVRQLAIAHAAQVQPVAWRPGTKTSKGDPEASMTGSFLTIRVRPASRHVTLALLAQAFITMIRTDPKRRRRDDPLPGPARTADRARLILGACPLCTQPLTLGRRNATPP